MPKVGVIGGSGLYQIPGLIIKEYKQLTTPFGAPSDTYMIGELSGREIVFLPRHGFKHHIPPHRINCRANIWGFKELGVERIISVSAVGGIGFDIRPGMIIVPDQIIDMTNGRESTFYDDNEVVHIDFTEPYCPELRESLFRGGENSGIELRNSGIYVCMNGPRLETRAEIKMFSIIGADIVGMTAMPEAVLARELELCFVGVAVVTNYAAGITDKRLTTTEVIETMKMASERVGNLLCMTFSLIPNERNCACKDVLKEARM
jgi:5'-methylthioadenosine phosphorylase